MTNFRIGGVPEHFNLPWHDLIAAGAPARDGVALEWTDYPSGTGAMVADLDAGALDLAVLLTEGAVAGAANGRALSLLSLYTSSPLIWGIHVPAASPYTNVDELAGGRFGISREGSGSHLMAFALARERGWNADELEFVTVGGLDGAIEAFAAGAADVFLWEKFMTSPLVAAGAFRRLADFAAPWPAFVVCASNAVIGQRALLQTIVARVLEQAAVLKASPDAARRIARRYGLEERVAAEWLTATQWAAGPGIGSGDVEPAVELLRACRVIDADAAVPL